MQMEVQNNYDPMVDSSREDECFRFFRIYRTILEILEYRQFFVGEDAKKTELEFRDKYNSRELLDKRDFFPPLTEPGEDEEYDRSIAVFYNFKGDEITDDFLNRVVKSCDKIYNFFIVAPSQNRKSATGILDRKATLYVKEMSKGKGDEPPYKFEIFRQEELLFNVLRHDLVPEHRLMSQAKKVELLHKYKVKESQLPKILLNDPVARFLGLKRGDVVKIIRKSETAGTYTTYRIAV